MTWHQLLVLFHLNFFSVCKCINYFLNIEWHKIYLYVENAKICLNLIILNNVEVNNRQNVEILWKFLGSVAKWIFWPLKIFQFRFNFCSGVSVKCHTRGLLQLLLSFSLWWTRPLLLNFHETPMAFGTWGVAQSVPRSSSSTTQAQEALWLYLLGASASQEHNDIFMQELAVVLSKFGSQRASMHEDKIGVASDWFQSGFNMPGPSVLQIKSSSIKWHYVLNR